MQSITADAVITKRSTPPSDNFSCSNPILINLNTKTVSVIVEGKTSFADAEFEPKSL